MMTTMACSEVDQLLGAYAMSALDPPDQVAVERHLTGCDRHRASIDELRRITDRLLLAVPEREPRPELRARILDAIRADSAATSVTLGWSEQRLDVGSHACVFHSGDHGLKQSMSFLRVGLDQPEEFGVLFADERRFGSLTDWLQEGYAGSVPALVNQGKLALIGGAPNIEGLIEKIGGRLDKALSDGYKLIRLLGFIGWEQPGCPDNAAIVEFERQVNAVVRGYPAVVVCTYDIPKLPAYSVMEGGFRNHPITILGNRIVRDNPFYFAA